MLGLAVDDALEDVILFDAYCHLGETQGGAYPPELDRVPAPG